MTDPVMVSAYAASPAFAAWDPDLEDAFLRGLMALPGVSGLEVPWIGGLHPHDTAWFLTHVPAGARLAITPLPWVMRRCAGMATYGIASPDAEGRAAALADLERVRADVRRIGQESPAEVAIVELHTAPHLHGDQHALEQSLEAVASWDWHGAQLVIEHCDAAVAGQRHEKGFLSVEAELAAIERTGTPVGMWLNWGRSAIELRDADRVTEQFRQVAASGRLVGAGISGVGTEDGPFGAAWIDAHLPILETYPESHSMLDGALVRAALEATGEVPWTTLKISRRPDDLTAAAALATVEANLRILRAAR